MVKLNRWDPITKFQFLHSRDVNPSLDRGTRAGLTRKALAFLFVLKPKDRVGPNFKEPSTLRAELELDSTRPEGAGPSQPFCLFIRNNQIFSTKYKQIWNHSYFIIQTWILKSPNSNPTKVSCGCQKSKPRFESSNTKPKQAQSEFYSQHGEVLLVRIKTQVAIIIISTCNLHMEGPTNSPND